MNNKSFSLSDWIQKNQIFASAILLAFVVITSMIIHAFTTRYYVDTKNHVNIDRWTGEVQEWEQ